MASDFTFDVVSEADLIRLDRLLGEHGKALHEEKVRGVRLAARENRTHGLKGGFGIGLN